MDEGASSDSEASIEREDDDLSPSAFTSLDAIASDPAAWDDTVLVAAYDAAIASYHGRPAAPPRKPSRPTRSPTDEARAAPQRQARGKQSRPREPPAHAAFPARPPANSALHTHPPGLPAAVEPASSRGVPLMFAPPPPPPFLGGVAPGEEGGLGPELEALLASWYEAGYRAGRYAALRERDGGGQG